jgi:hypothetical protein
MTVCFVCSFITMKLIHFLLFVKTKTNDWIVRPDLNQVINLNLNNINSNEFCTTNHSFVRIISFFLEKEEEEKKVHFDIDLKFNQVF